MFSRKSYADLGKKQATISTATPAPNSSCNGPSVAKSCQCDPMWKMPLDLSLRSREIRFCEKERSSAAFHSASFSIPWCSFDFLLASLMRQLKAASLCQVSENLPFDGSAVTVRWIHLYKSETTGHYIHLYIHPTAILFAQCRKFHTLAEDVFISPALTLTTACIYTCTAYCYPSIYMRL